MERKEQKTLENKIKVKSPHRLIPCLIEGIGGRGSFLVVMIHTYNSA